MLEERKKELEKLTVDQLIELADKEYGLKFGGGKPLKAEAVSTILELEQEKRDKDLSLENERLREEKAELEGQNEVLRGELKIASKQIDELKTKESGYDEFRHRKQQEKNELETQIAVRDTEIATLKDEKAVLESRITEIEKGLLENLNNPVDYLVTINKTEAEAPSFGTGNNIVNVSTVINLSQRMRAGFTFTRKTTTYYLTDDELAAVKADAHLIIHGKVEKRETE